MYQSSWSYEARITALSAETRRLLDEGRVAEALGCQREAVDEARRLAVRLPADLRPRQGLAAVLYHYGSILVSADDPSGAVPVLDECLALYASMADAAPDISLLCADVRARRGLALGMQGRAASAAVDTEVAVLAYLTETHGSARHPLVRDLARVLSINAAVLARHGDPGLAVASADAALGFYASAAGRRTSRRLSADDGGYLRSAASVSALFHLAAGNLADGFRAAEVAVGTLVPDQLTESLEREMGLVQGLLAAAEVDRPVPIPVEHGRMLAGALLPVLRAAPVLWLPPGEPGASRPGDSAWPGWRIQPTLEDALDRHATAAAQDALAADRPRELVFTPTMRWPWRQLECGRLLGRLAVEVLPHAYADGLRLALDALVLLAAAERSAEYSEGNEQDADTRLLRGRLLQQTAAACRAAGDDALAQDLAAWARRER